MRKIRGAVKEAIKDARFLLNRGYRRQSVIKFVSDKYQLQREESWILLRGVFSDREARETRKKIIDLKKVRELAIDGYNVLITCEHVLSGKFVMLADDGVVRDVAGVFGKYRMRAMTKKVIGKILNLLKGKEVYFYFDKQVSKSGQLASMVRKLMEEYNMKGEVHVVRYVDRELKKYKVVASSDRAVIEKVRGVVDIPKLISKIISYFVPASAEARQ